MELTVRSQSSRKIGAQHRPFLWRREAETELVGKSFTEVHPYDIKITFHS
jgi:hypothetical protein